MNRYMAAAFARSSNQVAADILADPDAGKATDELAAADALLGLSKLAFRGHRYLAAAFAADAAYAQVRRGARQAGVPVVGSTEGWQVDQSGSAPTTDQWPRGPPTRRAGSTATGCVAERDGASRRREPGPPLQ